MGYFFHHKRDRPLKQICCQILKILKLFLKICVQFQAFKNVYPPKKQKHMRKFEVKKKRKKKKLVLDKIILFGSDTEILAYGSRYQILVSVAH